jgi:hypothetical protein
MAAKKISWDTQAVEEFRQMVKYIESDSPANVEKIRLDIGAQRSLEEIQIRAEKIFRINTPLFTSNF